MSKAEYSTEEMMAMRVNAMLMGLDGSTFPNTEDDDIEIEIVDEEPKRKRGRTKSKDKEVKNPAERPKVPMVGKFENLPKSLKLPVLFYGHDIHYKEQLWGIPKTTVVYNIELLDNPKLCVDTCKKFKDTPEDIQRAKEGKARYYRVVTFESVVGQVATIAWVKVSLNKDGKLFSSVSIMNRLKEFSINPETLRKDIQKTMQQALKEAESAKTEKVDAESTKTEQVDA